MSSKYMDAINRMMQGGASGETEESASQRLRFQPWLTLAAPGGTDDIIQPCRHWLDGLNQSTYHFKVDLIYLTNATLVIESAQSPEGPWSQSQAFTSVTTATIVLSSEGGGIPFSRFLRWRVDGDAVSAWEICFQILVTSGALGDVKLIPRKA